MISRVALVSCVKSKLSVAAPAEKLYTSDLFRKMRHFASIHAERWYILSAEHGLLSPHEIIQPYEKTLTKMRKFERNAWAERVQKQLLQVLPSGATVIILAGERYRENLTPFLKANGFSVEVPLEGLPFGKQLQQLGQL